MDLVKKNWFSIVCGVVAILAIVAVFTFVGSQKTLLQKSLDARKKVYDDVTKLKSAQRHLPVVSIDPNATAPALTVFPGPTVIDQGKAMIAEVQTQSVDLEKLAISMNQHTLLVAGSLPQPGLGSSDAFSFARAYLEELQKGIPTRLDATTPPTQAQIDEFSNAETTRLTAAAGKNVVTGAPLNPEALQAVVTRRLAELPDELRRNAATQHKIYMFPSALSIHPDFASTSGQQLDAERIWFAQLSLWVQQDVVNAIIELNKASKKIDDSPVKQLIGIETGFGSDIYTLPVAAASAAAAPMGQATASPVAATTATDPLPKDISISPTGRVSNGVFDVVHFTVCMHVQAADINKVIQELQRNRFITALQSDVVAVNSLEEKEDGFLYGPQPVVTLTLKCEELFLRSWTRPLMPQPVKTLLNVQEPPPQATASAN
jgi:hypothetical protein